MVDIGLGSRINPEMVHMVDWPSGAMPPGAFTDAKALESRVARTSMQRGEPIMEGKLAPPGTKGGLSAVVAEGKRAITVRVNDVVGVAGFALPGNFVDILVNTQGEGAQNGSKDHTISKIVLERILVLAIAQESSRDETKPKVVNAVTLEVSPEQAERLDLARSVGSLSLVLRNQIDPDPVNTDGATKATLFNVKEPAELEPATKPKRIVKHVAAQAAKPPVDQVEVIKGLARSTQEF
jgi:pilus assembly protein CpaB